MYIIRKFANGDIFESTQTKKNMEFKLPAPRWGKKSYGELKFDSFKIGIFGGLTSSPPF